MSSAMEERSPPSPPSSAAIRSSARRTSGGGGASSASGQRSSKRARVAPSRASGSCTATTPRPPQAMPHRPIDVSKSVKCAVMIRRDRSTRRAGATWRILLLRCGPGSGLQDRAQDLAVDVGEPVVAPLELERQPRVVDAQAVEDRGVQIVDVDRVARDIVAEVVGLAVGQATLDAAAGE